MPQHADTPSAPLIFEVERFQHVAAGEERVLLRLDGRYGDQPGKRVLDAMLFVDDGLAVHRHAPVDDVAADADSWLWRAAFDIPASYLTDERTRFAIEAEPGALVDLARPGDIAPAGGAVPLTARAAHTARRYAAAIAVLVTVAVTPGVMPASARTEVLRVHRADGSVVYLTRDGEVLTEIPADAVFIDEQAADAAPGAPAADAPPAAAGGQDTPQPATPRHPAVTSGRTKDPADAAQPAVGGATERGAQTEDSGAPAVRTHRSRRHGPHHGHAPSIAPAPTAGATAPAPVAPRHHGHRHHHAAPVQPVDTQVLAEPATAGAPLEQMPGLMATTTSSDAQLQPLKRVGGNGTGARGVRRDGSETTLPGKDLESLGTLGGDAGTGGPAHDGATPTPALPGSDSSAPPLIQLVPSKGDNQNGASDGDHQNHSGDHHRTPRHDDGPRRHAAGGHDRHNAPATPAPIRRHDGSPTASNPTFFDALPGPAQPGAVPDFVIDKFRVPPFLLPIYQAAGIQYGIRWEVLAAINEIETDYGRNLNVSSAGALGWMQFMPATWKMYGVDANKDGKRDPFNPVDAIFAAARYLKAAGGDKDVRRAIFAYNHADWYVDSVMLRAKLIAGYPADLVSSLTGLTEGRFPVAARAKYADDLQEKPSAGKSAGDRGIDIFSAKGAPVVATGDGIVKKIGNSPTRGRYVVLQDVYGNQYTYSHLGSVAKLYPVPKRDAKAATRSNVHIVGAHDPAPKAPASAGAQRPSAAPKHHDRHSSAAAPRIHRKPAAAAGAPAGAPIAAVKQRLFAHPARKRAQKHGGFEQLLDQKGSGFETYDSYFAKPIGLNSRNAKLRPLRKGSRVVGSTILGRVGARGAHRAPHLHFEIRPAGRGAPKIDPKPILDGWKLLESTAIYRAKGKNALYGDGDFSIGEAMLLPKAMLAKRVLSDPRIEIYPQGRQDISTGQIDRRVLVVLEYLAESGLHPTVSCLRSGHSYMTASGNVSEHSSGNAVDISAINGTPILGHQGAGGVTETAVRRLMMLQGQMRPHQIISLLDFGLNTMALPDHANHIHVGFHPLYGANDKLGKEAQSVLKPGQWDNLVQRLGEIQNPSVPTKPSRYALPTRNAAGDE